MSESISGLTKPMVVVVEDDVIIRLDACEILTEAGFGVVETEHATQALAYLKMHAQKIHALFTDIHMPGELDGLALAHIAGRSWPWVALLITSGRASPLPHEMPSASRFVPKPYDGAEVIDHLRQMTAR